ncbi:MAG: hypothetical protein IJE10_11325 [Clostridia bacterium]|nr:hypothetical protein [Clostridia bacterium]
MVRTYKNSRFVLLSLMDIRDSKDIILQIEDAKTNFDSGQKCYLCEVVSPGLYFSDKDERALIREICELNNDKRKLEKKIIRLEKQIEQIRKEDEGK